MAAADSTSKPLMLRPSFSRIVSNRERLSTSATSAAERPRGGASIVREKPSARRRRFVNLEGLFKFASALIFIISFCRISAGA